MALGGPHVSMTDAATKAIFQSYQVEGGKEITLDLKVEEEKTTPCSHFKPGYGL